MYVMHDEAFLVEMLNMSIVQEVVTSYHCARGCDKTLLDKVPLRFNVFLLFHSLFDANMQQIFDMFSEYVNSTDDMHGIQH